MYQTIRCTLIVLLDVLLPLSEPALVYARKEETHTYKSSNRPSQPKVFVGDVTVTSKVLVT